MLLYLPSGMSEKELKIQNIVNKKECPQDKSSFMTEVRFPKALQGRTNITIDSCLTKNCVNDTGLPTLLGG